MSRRKPYSIPENLNPEADLCVPLFIPDDDTYINIILSHISDLEQDRLYKRDDNYSALVVREQFRQRTIAPFVKSLIEGVGCSGSDSGGFDCLQLTTTENVIKFEYNDPFLTDVSNSSFLGEWHRWQDLRDLLPEQIENFVNLFEDLTSIDADIGYFPNDCLIFPKIPQNPLDTMFGGIVDLAQFKFPYITVNLRGSGEFEIELLNTPLGGTAMVTWDFNPNVGDIVQSLIDGEPVIPQNTLFSELSRDMTQIPPSNIERNSIEIQLSEDGDHVVRVYFLPTIDYTNLQFVGFGGGIRSVTACGNLEFIGIDGATINQSNIGLREARDGIIKMSTYNDAKQAYLDALREFYAPAVAGGVNGGNMLSRVSIGNGDSGVNIVADSSGGNTSGISGTSDELEFGGWISIRQGLAEYYQAFEDYYGTYDQAEAEQLISALFDTNANITTAISEFYNYRAGGTQMNDDFTGLELVAYREPIVNSTVSEFIIDNLSPNIFLALSMLSAIDTSQLITWYQSGIPRDGYQSAVNYRNPDTEFIILESVWGSDHIDTGLPYKRPENWVFRAQCSGLIQVDANNVWDGVYRLNTLTDVKVYEPINITFRDTSFNFNNAEATHQPQYGIKDLEFISKGDSLREIRFDNVTGLNTNSTGQLTVIITDVGQS